MRTRVKFSLDSTNLYLSHTYLVKSSCHNSIRNSLLYLGGRPAITAHAHHWYFHCMRSASFFDEDCKGFPHDSHQLCSISKLEICPQLMSNLKTFSYRGYIYNRSSDDDVTKEFSLKYAAVLQPTERSHVKQMPARSSSLFLSPHPIRMQEYQFQYRCVISLATRP